MSQTVVSVADVEEQPEVSTVDEVNYKELYEKEQRMLMMVSESRAIAETASINKIKSLKRTRSLLIILASPTILLLSPVILLIWIIRSFLKVNGNIKIKLSAFMDFISRKDKNPLANVQILNEVFVMSGAEATFELIDRSEGSLPAGTRAIFTSMSTQDDEVWLRATNEWASLRGAPKILLKNGDGPRFERIVFDAQDYCTDGDLVTIIMPCFNSQSTVARSVQSMLAQTWRNIEVIAVNDASTDRTGDVLDALAKDDPRLIVMHNKVNVGPYVSKNRALTIAKGRYVTGHDADDLAFPNRIETQIQPLLDDSRCLASIASMVRMDKDGRPCRLGRVTSLSFDGVCHQAFISLFIDRAWLLQNVGFWDSVRFAADSELIARVTKVMGFPPTKIEKAVMFCLFSADSLIGNPITGVQAGGGISPVRRAYKDSFLGWHASRDSADLIMPFPCLERKFEAPEEMIVRPADVQENLGQD